MMTALPESWAANGCHSGLPVKTAGDDSPVNHVLPQPLSQLRKTMYEPGQRNQALPASGPRLLLPESRTS
jgi:hypothetical protein